MIGFKKIIEKILKGDEMVKILKDKKVEGEAGAGLVKVVINGCMEVESVEIDKSIMNKKDKKFLEELIKVAINEGVEKLKKEIISAVTEEIFKLQQNKNE